jgi:hypothetical protein
MSFLFPIKSSVVLNGFIQGQRKRKNTLYSIEYNTMKSLLNLSAAVYKPKSSEKGLNPYAVPFVPSRRQPTTTVSKEELLPPTKKKS